MPNLNLAKIKKIKTGMSFGGWCYDSHPYLDSLDAGKTIEVANIKGPAVINWIHILKHEVQSLEDERKKAMPRGIVLLVYYNDEEIPSVQVPLADFFCDGVNGKCAHFSNIFFEHVPESYNCFIPMPFEKSCRVCLRNDTKFDTWSSSHVEYEQLEDWDDSLGYFHSTYNRVSFKLNPDLVLNIFKLSNCSGHIIGRQLSISTDEPLFGGFHFIMEGNNEIRIDTNKPDHDGPYKRGETATYDYLGSEDFFGFSWGWNYYNGLRMGTPYYKTINLEGLLFKDKTLSYKNKVKADEVKGITIELQEKVANVLLNLESLNSKEPLSQLSTYRLFSPNIIRFNKSIDWRINWKHEYKFENWEKEYRKMIGELKDKSRLYVDYADIFYWYQNKIGHEHLKLPSVEERTKEVLNSNAVKEMNGS